MELRVQKAETVALAVIRTGAVGQFTARPVSGVTVGVTLMLPAKLNLLVSIAEIPAPDAPVLKLTGLAEIMKSPM